MRIVSIINLHARDSALSRIADILGCLDADLVCLQEVGDHWNMGERCAMAPRIARAAGLPHAYFSGALESGAGHYGIAALSRLPLLDLRVRPLVRGRDERRVLVDFVTSGAAPLHVFTSHVSVVDGDRPSQCRQIAESIARDAASGPPVVLVGDLNARWSSPELRDLCHETGLRSCLVEHLGQSPATYPTSAPEADIDHILVDERIRIVAAGVVTASGSDHLPIWADLEP